MIIKFIRAFMIDHRRDDEDDHKVVFVRTFMMDLMQRDAEDDDDGHGGGSMDDEEQDDDNAWTIRFSTISSTSHNHNVDGADEGEDDYDGCVGQFDKNTITLNQQNPSTHIL